MLEVKPEVAGVQVVIDEPTRMLEVQCRLPASKRDTRFDLAHSFIDLRADVTGERIAARARHGIGDWGVPQEDSKTHGRRISSVVAVRAALREQGIRDVKTKAYWIPGKTGLD